jgi:predicted Zn-dependent peptidase
MNLLLAQVDLFLTEMFADVFMSVLTTYYYLNTDPQDKKQLEIEVEVVTNPMILDEEIDDL